MYFNHKSAVTPPTVFLTHYFDVSLFAFCPNGPKAEVLLLVKASELGQSATWEQQAYMDN